MNWGAALAPMALAAMVAFTGCTADRPPPTPLETYAPQIAGRAVWNAKFGAISPLIVPSSRDGVFIVATLEGSVIALQADSGAVLWQASVDAPISAGVGTDGRFVSVVTRKNEVVTFDSGREIWRKRVPSSVVTPPLVAGERVFVMGVDRAAHAFDVLDGRRLWTLQRPGEALTLAQPGVLAPFRNTLLVGQGARLTAVDPLRGTVLWELPMASPRGSNEVERLADLVGPLVRVGDRVCARAFQSAVACVDAARASVLWSRNAGGTNAVAGDAERLYGADATDRMTGWNASNGDIVWSHEALLYRGLSGALAVGPVVVFGDSEGFVHFLSGATGEQQLRLPTDGSPVLGTPVLSGSTLLVFTKSGGLFAFRPN